MEERDKAPYEFNGVVTLVHSENYSIIWRLFQPLFLERASENIDLILAI